MWKPTYKPLHQLHGQGGHKQTQWREWSGTAEQNKEQDISSSWISYGKPTSSLGPWSGRFWHPCWWCRLQNTHCQRTRDKKTQFSLITLCSNSCAKDPHIQLIMVWVHDYGTWSWEVVSGLLTCPQVEGRMVWASGDRRRPKWIGCTGLDQPQVSWCELLGDELGERLVRWISMTAFDDTVIWLGLGGWWSRSHQQ